MHRDHYLYLLMVLFVFTSCETDVINVDKKKDVVRTSELKNLALSVDYDVETVTTSKPSERADVSMLTVFDSISMVPRVTREQVSFKISLEGDAEMVIQKKQPVYPLVVKHDVPEDDSPKVVYTVLRNNTMTLYDANYRPIGVPMQAPLPNYKDLVEQLQKGATDDLMAKFLGGSHAIFGKTKKNDFSKVKHGGIVLKERKDLPNGRVKIVTESADGIHVAYYDTKYKVTLGTALYGKDKRLKVGNAMFYKDNGDKTLQLMSADVEVLSKNENGVEFETHHYKRYHKFKIVNHLKK